MNEMEHSRIQASLDALVEAGVPVPEELESAQEAHDDIVQNISAVVPRNVKLDLGDGSVEHLQTQVATLVAASAGKEVRQELLKANESRLAKAEKAAARSMFDTALDTYRDAIAAVLEAEKHPAARLSVADSVEEWQAQDARRKAFARYYYAERALVAVLAIDILHGSAVLFTVKHAGRGISELYDEFGPSYSQNRGFEVLDIYPGSEEAFAFIRELSALGELEFPADYHEARVRAEELAKAAFALKASKGDGTIGGKAEAAA